MSQCADTDLFPDFCKVISITSPASMESFHKNTLILELSTYWLRGDAS